MKQVKQSIQQIISSKDQKPALYSSILQLITKNDQQISQTQTKTIQSSVLMSMMSKKLSRQPSQQFYTFLQQFIDLVYAKKSQLIKLVYQLIPTILLKYIQSAQQKISQLQNCIKTIYNNQLVDFNKKLISKELLMGKSGDIGNLYKQHFHSIIKTTNQVGNLSQIGKNEQITSFNRVNVVNHLFYHQKSVLLFSVFNNLQLLTQKSVISYLWMVYVYCGGTQQQQQTGVSLYLLQKKNMFSIFKYYMSGEEMSIILLTLYQLSVQRKKNKFEILSAINMIHKKAANQSMFKLSEVAQSIIHLLEDEYSEAFS